MTTFFEHIHDGCKFVCRTNHWGGTKKQFHKRKRPFYIWETIRQFDGQRKEFSPKATE
jgi:hypothetical protein